MARQVAWLAKRGASIEPRLALFGGLTNDPTYVEAVQSALNDCLPNWSAKPAAHSPVIGALYLSLRQTAPTEAPEGSAGKEAGASKEKSAGWAHPPQTGG